MKRGKGNKLSMKRLLIFFSILFILISGILLWLWYEKLNDSNSDEKDKLIVEKLDLNKIKKSYSDFVKTNDGTKLYLKDNEEYVVETTVYGEVELALDPNYEVVDEYFKVLNKDLYVLYKDVTGIDVLTKLSGEYKSYSNYIPYNESIVLKSGAKLYVSENSYYEVNNGTYPIIVKDTERYGIEYQDRLVYVLKTDVESVIENINTDKKFSDGLAVLNYHYVVNKEAGELKECVQEICITDTMFDTHMKYLSDNGYYSVSMRDLELFIDGKVQLPEKSVSITIDDGWYVNRTISILEKYKMLATLFLIGSLASPDNYVSEYLEIHSHTWDMHNVGVCPSNVGRGGILCLDENTVLEDLKKSRESLNNTTYFCYPFYDYNKRAIELLKKAGFTMAFAGELRDSTVRVGQDKYKIPRYVIVNYTTMNNFISYVS